MQSLTRRYNGARYLASSSELVMEEKRYSTVTRHASGWIQGLPRTSQGVTDFISSLPPRRMLLLGE
jgi:hypothetical protein